MFNPVVRSKLTAVHEASSKVMKYDLNTLTEHGRRPAHGRAAPDAEGVRGARKAGRRAERGRLSRDYIRAKLDTIRKNVRAFQAQQRHSLEVVDEGLSELDGRGLAGDPPSTGGGDAGAAPPPRPTTRRRPERAAPQAPAGRIAPPADQLVRLR